MEMGKVLMESCPNLWQRSHPQASKPVWKTHKRVYVLSGTKKKSRLNLDNIYKKAEWQPLIQNNK